MKLNPWLAERLKGLRVDPSLRVIVEVEPKEFNEVLAKLKGIKGVKVVSTSFDRFITVVVPAPQTLEDIERIPGVIEIHYDMPRGILPFPFGSRNDPLLGEVRLSSVEVPGFPLPIATALPLPGVCRPGIEIIPTSRSKRVVVDLETTLTGAGVKAYVLDTGVNPFHVQVIGSPVEMFTTVPEAPFDMMGHGQWCSMMVYGRPFLTRFGVVEGIAPKAKKGHVKVLTTAGFGSDSSIMKGMEIAMKRGAKVVSMSLGGPQQGSVDHDPLVKATKILHDAGVIVVVAAGNSGPSQWTIGSPGCSPWVLTVGSVSILDDLQVVWFSSRGPQGDWYAKNRSDYEEDLRKYGDLLIKPDVVAPGGGRVHESDKPDEVLYQGITGWFDGFYDLAVDSFEGMHGTSQATPHVAGLMTLLAEAVDGLTVDAVKEVLRRQVKEKSPVDGWGLITLSLFAR